MTAAAAANAAWWLASVPAAARFAAALRDPGAAQERLLHRYLADNKGTAFGRAHGFADIRTPEQFARRVEPRDYDALVPWIDRIRIGERNILTRQPVRRLVPTSGSTAARKLIPYTTGFQDELNVAIGPWVVDLFRRDPRVARGPAYWSISPVAESGAADEEPSAVPIGFDADAEYLGGWRRRLVDAAMAVPASVSRIRDVDEWRATTASILVRRRDLAMISVWHPSFLELLIDEVRARHTHEDLATLWPRLRVVSCWADGAARAAASRLATLFPRATIQPKGLIATEGIVSIPYAGLRPLAVRSHFLEFEDDAGRISIAPDLQLGRTYGVLLTTAGGLCRYRLHDLVRVDGFVQRTPSITFVGKAGLTSDLAGEKLADGFVATVLEQLFVGEKQPAFTLLAPDRATGTPFYTLYTSAPACAERLDALLCANPHYAYCRRLGQLEPARVVHVGGDAYARYCRRLRERGQRLGDIKPASLSRLDGWHDWFSGHTPETKNVAAAAQSR